MSDEIVDAEIIECDVRPEPEPAVPTQWAVGPKVRIKPAAFGTRFSVLVDGPDGKVAGTLDFSTWERALLAAQEVSAVRNAWNLQLALMTLETHFRTDTRRYP